ncbi:hypothetical protein JIG36_29815 [Actinoplanes sp. LDG1-06]|uniref:SipW-cognate class signal peptide n=1 Tax=Paractinoplanes ovalisporus TaxID=2810368 RepID=A0ABS2AIV3_9ACTN|nr:hypothetical protein [Actinoplanes ovalisporus]MBM2619713.1 hypothetical protein [Actinoplanes ovalisporus]
MSENKRRRRGGIAILVGIMACSAVVWQSSNAAFSSQAPNNANTVGAGTVTIVNSSATAMFASSDAALAPGQSRTVCLGVRYNGSLATPTIKMYFTGALERNTEAGNLDPWADDYTSRMDDDSTMQIQVNNTNLGSDPGNNCDPGVPGSVGTFSNVVAATSVHDLIKDNTNFTNGLATATPWGTVTAGQWRVFKFIYTLNTGADNAAQGDAVQFNVVWEAQK